jgi:hypothetical protein
MLRVLCLLMLGASLVAASGARAEDWTWSKDHPEARERLLKIFEKHEGFREAMTTFSVEHHGIFKEMVEFLAEKGDHTIEKFVRARAREDKETPHLERIREKHKDAMEAFHNWIRDHKEAALALTHHERELEHLERVAEKRDR